MTASDARAAQVPVVPGACAAIDLGTQTALCLIARRSDGGQLEAIEDHAFSARLGEGLERDGVLQDAAIERTLDVLRTFVRRCELRGVPADRVRAVGTAVLRRAADADRLLDRAAHELGLTIEVLSGEEEARLGHGAAALVLAPEDRARALIVDVGGGSTELAWDGGRERISLDVGAVVWTERYFGRGGRGPRLPGGRDAFAAALAQLLEGFPPRVGSDRQVVCLGGTASNLACLEQDLESFDARLAEGATVHAGRAVELAEELLAEDVEARMDRPIEPDRAEILPAGLWILGASLERIGARDARVTGKGLRYGVAREVLSAGG